MKVTENFDLGEFACKCGCGFNVISYNLVHRLQVIRDIVGVKMIINSGCRCPTHNLDEGGGKRSEHLRGRAADFHFDGEESTRLLKQVGTRLLPNWSGGLHYYPKKGFCHADIGLRRRWK